MQGGIAVRVANDEAGFGLREGHAPGYFGSRILSRWSWRGYIRDDAIASNSSFDQSSVAKLRRGCGARAAALAPLARNDG
jgi:hypothetical protein